MHNFLILILALKLSQLSFSWRFKSHLNTLSPPTLVAPRRKNLYSIQDDTQIQDSEDQAQSKDPEEGWLMELNEENVEGVLDLVRPQLSADGGGINLCKIVENEVFVKFSGSCVGCPYRSTTLKEVIENNLARLLKSPNGSPICVKVAQDNM